MSDSANSLKEPVLFFSTVMLISSSSILIVASTSPSSTIVFTRLLWAALILAPLINWKSLRTINSLALLVGGIFLSLHFLLWVQSLKIISVASSISLVMVAPVFTAALSHIMLKEAFSRREWIGLILAVVAIMVIFPFEWDSFSKPLGCIMAVGGGLAYSFFAILTRKLRKQIPLWTFNTSMYFSAGVITLLYSALVENLSPLSWFSLNTKELLILLGLAVLPTIGGHGLLNRLSREKRLVYTNLAMLCEIPGTLVLAFFFFKTVPNLNEAIGCVLMISGIYVSIKK